VSSFSALVKGRGFILIFSPKAVETGLALALCLAFLAVVGLVRRLGPVNQTAVQGDRK
jgi:hypothetical protein